MLSRRSVILFSLIFSAYIVASVLAEEVGRPPEGFRRTGHWVAEENGRALTGSFFERRSPWQVLVPYHQGCLEVRIRPRHRVYLFQVDCESLARGSVPPSSRRRLQGRFHAAEILVRTGEGTVKLRPRTPLVGRLDPAVLRSTFPEYAENYEKYVPSPGDLDQLGSLSDHVEITVFLGTWCGLCETYVPRVMKVIDALEREGITVSYVGIGAPVSEDDLGKANGVDAVPLVRIRSSNGQEYSLHYPELEDPAATMVNLLVRGGS